MLISLITRLNNKKIVRFITRVICLSPVDQCWLSQPALTSHHESELKSCKIDKWLFDVYCLFTHLFSPTFCAPGWAGLQSQHSRLVAEIKWSSVITRLEWKSSKLLPGQLPSSSRKSSTSHDSANFDCKAKLVDKKACLVKSGKVLSLNNQLSWSVLALTPWWHFLHWFTEKWLWDLHIILSQ